MIFVDRGRHPSQKTASAERYHKGETPIEKNVRVIDDQGNVYEATWPKRAKQLVKQGRARFLSEDLICLACPPKSDMNLEDKAMFDMENMPMNDNPETVEVPEAPKAPEAPKPPKAPAMDQDYLLRQIAAIQNDTAYLKEALEQINQLGAGDETKICAIQGIVATREETNRRLLDFYQEMYRDQKTVTMDMEWMEKLSAGAGKAAEKMGQTAEKMGQTAKDWGGKVKVWLKDLDAGSAAVIRPARESRSLRDKVLDALRDPELCEENREMILQYMDRLKTLSPEMQDQALEILSDQKLESEEIMLILENLEAINSLDD